MRKELFIRGVDVIGEGEGVAAEALRAVGEGEYRLLRFSYYTIVPRGYFPLFSFFCL